MPHLEWIGPNCVYRETIKQSCCRCSFLYPGFKADSAENVFGSEKLSALPAQTPSLGLGKGAQRKVKK